MFELLREFHRDGAIGVTSNGLCWCGCGQPTGLATQTNTAKGLAKGLPCRYLPGHQHRLATPEIEIGDCGYETPCWVWQRALTTAGYGSLTTDGTRKYAHRVYYERYVGPIPEGLDLDHLCRNRACVNPAHLEVVTHAENMRRAIRTILTADDVRALLVMVREGYTNKTIAEQFGVSASLVSNIKHGHKWQDIWRESLA